MQQAQDNPKLLDLLIAYDAAAPAEFRTTPYWAPYAARIIAELRRNGLKDFRTNHRILKGYGSSVMPQPTLPRAAWKRAIWNGAASMPVVSLIVSEYERLVRGLALQVTRSEVNLAREVLKAIAAQYPQMKIPDGTTNGGARDGFEWQGQQVSAAVVRYLARAAGFYAAVPPQSVTSMLEVGPGLGMSTLAHKALNPHLKLAVNVDIVPVGYVAGQYLVSIPGVEVVDYAALRDRERIVIEPGNGFRVYNLPVWSLPKVEGNIDYAFNAYSFQEMEPEAAARYAGEFKRLCIKGAMIQNSVLGVAEDTSPQHKAVTTAFVRDLLAEKFPKVDDIATDWDRMYDGASEGNVIVLRA